MAALIDVPHIVSLVCDYYCLRSTLLLAGRRSPTYVRARMMIVALAREITPYSTPELGDQVGLTYSSVIRLLSKHAEAMRSQQDRRYAADYQVLRQRLEVLGADR